MRKFYLVFIVLSCVSLCCTAQDSLSTIYFYRVPKIAGVAVGYTIRHNGVDIGRIKSGSAFVYKCKPGPQTFTTSTEGSTSISLDVQANKSYFVECGISVGVAVGRPTLYEVTVGTAKEAIRKIDLSIANTIHAEFVKRDPSGVEDTIRAVRNLFQRKRTGGTVRAVIFGGLSLFVVVRAATAPDDVVYYNGQSIDIGSGSSPGDYLVGAAFAVVAITGISQTSHYQARLADRIIYDYKLGTPLTKKIKSKFKTKDFR